MVSLEFVNPLTGAPAVSTFAGEIHRLYPGARTATSKTGRSVYVVFQGSGSSLINGVRFECGPGDLFVTPSWASVDHELRAALSRRTCIVKVYASILPSCEHSCKNAPKQIGKQGTNTKRWAS